MQKRVVLYNSSGNSRRFWLDQRAEALAGGWSETMPENPKPPVNRRGASLSPPPPPPPPPPVEEDPVVELSVEVNPDEVPEEESAPEEDRDV